VRVAPPAVDTRDEGDQQRDRMRQQTRVGGVGHVGLHHGGVRAQLVQLDEFVLVGLGQQRVVELVHSVLAAAGGDLAQRGRMRHSPAQRETAVDALLDEASVCSTRSGAYGMLHL
jgi:hypothetical protein